MYIYNKVGINKMLFDRGVDLIKVIEINLENLGPEHIEIIVRVGVLFILIVAIIGAIMGLTRK